MNWQPTIIAWTVASVVLFGSALGGELTGNVLLRGVAALALPGALVAFGVWRSRTYDKRQRFIFLLDSTVVLGAGLAGYTVGGGIEPIIAFVAMCVLIFVVNIVGYPLVVLSGAGRAKHRPRGPYCPECEYHLVGVAEHRCPECGRPFTLYELGISQRDLEPDTASTAAPR